MIIQQEVSAPIITSIGAAPSKFKIKASAKAFKILSGFYSEPILAIPRELGANAWDAHVKAKNTKQMFEVHAPNTLEPWFSIRDFGTGLSPEDIDQIYTTYFESTKTSDNDSDGCMGLGSKTPFNYTENFSVISYYKGTKYVYNCFIDESGSPNIMPVCNEETAEHNGMEIKFGVKIADIQMFVEKVTRAYEPFRYRPIITGASIIFKAREYGFEGTNWSMRKNEGAAGRYTSRGGCRAFMGNYSYPINYDAIRGYIGEHVKDSNLTGKVYTLLNSCHFDFFYNIGDLEVAPNKEQLQYDGDHKTAKAVVDRALVALKELREIVNKQLVVPKTMWEAMSLYVKYNSYNGPHNNVRSIIGDIQIRFNGEDIESGNMSVDSVNVKLGLVPKSNDPYVPSKLPEKFSIGVLQYRANADKFIIKEKGHYTVTEKGEFPIFLYTNEESLKKARVRHFLKTKYPNGIIPDTMIVTDKTPGFKAFKAHCAYLGIPDSTIINVEQLPKPPRVPREAKTATTDEINYIEFSSVDITPTRYHNSMTWWKKANTFDGKETYYYIDFYYADPVKPDGSDLGSKVDELLRFLKAKNVLTSDKVTHIWGINVKNKPLLKVGNWVNIYDLAKKEIKKHQETIEQNLYLLGQNDALSRMANVRKLVGETQLRSKLTNKDTVEKFSNLIKLAKEVQEVPTDAVSLGNMFGIKAKENIPLIVNLKELEKLLEEKYMGIFTMIDHYSSPTAKLARVINFIDEKS